MIQPLRSIPITGTSTLLRVDPPPCSASVLSFLWFLPFEFLPYHRNDRFPRSPQEPESGSRYLYAGCRSSSKQVSLELVLEDSKTSSFDLVQFISTPHQ